eukprot:2705541-Rhodomonas_salina.1
MATLPRCRTRECSGHFGQYAVGERAGMPRHCVCCECVSDAHATGPGVFCALWGLVRSVSRGGVWFGAPWGLVLGWPRVLRGFGVQW